MNRIALMLKGISFTIRNEIPWESKTQTPLYNPLEKLPILIFPNSDRPPVYESAHIQNYIVEKYADRGPALLPGGVDANLQAKQIVMLSVGCMDALVLSGWEVRRAKQMQSQKWIDRQDRKINGAIRAFKDYVEAAKGREYLLGDELTIADIGVMCVVDFIEYAGLRPDWKEQYPALKEYYDRLIQLEVFKETRPVMFDLTEQIV
ncbi:hypothetical protein N0V94_004452 [Neodidymelliopsis sp. IMI 364377]|nr:hypothetical protein N0V94_004452 [Neodidymelliopsis sp. IMI 364377]